MYGEMLMGGWIEDEQKKQSYYRHIHDESERLTRLIQNVLSLSQLERGQWEVQLTKEDPARLISDLVKQLPDSTEIVVRDFGPGIPRRERKRIFQQFYRVGSEMTRSAQGTGIGLSLVKLLMEAMGGKVKVSDRRPGAEFRLIFPVHS